MISSLNLGRIIGGGVVVVVVIIVIIFVSSFGIDGLLSGLVTEMGMIDAGESGSSMSDAEGTSTTTMPTPSTYMWAGVMEV